MKVIEMIKKRFFGDGSSYVVEFHSGSSSKELASECYLSNVSIDPTAAQANWNRIAGDLFAEQVSDYPHLMHSALADSLNKKARNVRG